ncbi:hypothetical protein PAESOLCIP111_05807 [Paenibacillus solanacearum]|uniref:Chromate transporter n=1 Tax=Paenibacillus solanacearum TaxID=2048548 RepID=A0A916NRR0_9BACL|nr:chromate transporter [Paenibacillus solanacearum]CAG7649167.1 hypothetical protein PAESOLCIP111_05807 [Paenibacillus solanacearum]
MKSTQLQQLWSIFTVFLRISPATFGGGYAMIPIIEREVVHKKQWLAADEMCDILSISGSAPGGIGVNAAAFVGYRLAGVGGAAVAVIGITFPTFVIAFLLSLVFSMFQHHPKVAAALDGIHAAVVALILVAAYRMAKTAVFDKTTFATMICTLALLLSVPIHPLSVILFGLVVGIVFIYMKERLGVPVRLDKNDGEVATVSGYVYPDYFIADGI